MPVDLFSLDPPSSPISRVALGVARPLLSRLLGIEELTRVHRSLQSGAGGQFFERALGALRIDVSDGGSLHHIPATGPLIVAANHPQGILDGLSVAALVRRVRPDAKLVVNRLLVNIPELQESCFFVDPFDGPGAAARSLAGLRAAHLWLRQGHALILFPSGSVAHERGDHGTPVDARWTPALSRLAHRSSARIVPTFIAGENSGAFYAAGRVHPLLRTALLPNELLRKRGSRVSVTFGTALEPQAAGDDVARLTESTRDAVVCLASGNADSPCCHSSRTPIEIAALPEDACLVDTADFRVYVASAREIPSVLIEIGRLRAEAYRAAGEGAGTDLDLDRFDEHYLHLFTWDRRRQRIAGAYRVGCVDDIVRERGVNGLYTRTLFEYGLEFIEHQAPALELGRSFVSLEYQKHHQALLLLWRGIGAFVGRHPHYRVLFGPVSISARYSDASQAILASFLEHNHLDIPLARLVRPSHEGPVVSPESRETRVPASAAEADRLVATLEPDGKGMPVLLRQYLKLNARAIAFSTDPDFGGVLDALMAVDLLHVDRSLLKRYLGESCDDYLRIHHRTTRTAA